LKGAEKIMGASGERPNVVEKVSADFSSTWRHPDTLPDHPDQLFGMPR